MYRKRPLRLLADCEYNLKLLVYKQSQKAKLFSKSPTFSNLTETKYARAYKQLIQTAETHGIRLAISNFPLAVNRQSPPDVAEFFRPLHPVPVYWHVNANVAHNQLVQQLAGTHPGVCFVDVLPHLDGEYDKYLDLMHLTQEGDRQLAENFFAGIRAILETDLISPRAVSEPPKTR
jgi:lysophospholipase L1-like esterase